MTFKSRVLFLISLFALVLSQSYARAADLYFVKGDYTLKVGVPELQLVPVAGPEAGYPAEQKAEDESCSKQQVSGSFGWQTRLNKLGCALDRIFSGDRSAMRNFHDRFGYPLSLLRLSVSQGGEDPFEWQDLPIYYGPFFYLATPQSESAKRATRLAETVSALSVLFEVLKAEDFPELTGDVLARFNQLLSKIDDSDALLCAAAVPEDTHLLEFLLKTELVSRQFAESLSPLSCAFRVRNFAAVRALVKNNPYDTGISKVLSAWSSEAFSDLRAFTMAEIVAQHAIDDLKALLAFDPSAVLPSKRSKKCAKLRKKGLNLVALIPESMPNRAEWVEKVSIQFPERVSPVSQESRSRSASPALASFDSSPNLESGILFSRKTEQKTLVDSERTLVAQDLSRDLLSYWVSLEAEGRDTVYRRISHLLARVCGEGCFDRPGPNWRVISSEAWESLLQGPSSAPMRAELRAAEKKLGVLRAVSFVLASEHDDFVGIQSQLQKQIRGCRQSELQMLRPPSPFRENGVQLMGASGLAGGGGERLGRGGSAHEDQQLIFAYVNAKGIAPFHDWLRDLEAVNLERVQNKLRTVTHGDLGDHHQVGEKKVWEFRFHHHGGTRIYFIFDGRDIVLLHGATNKDKQKLDVVAAEKLAENYWSTRSRTPFVED